MPLRCAIDTFATHRTMMQVLYFVGNRMHSRWLFFFFLLEHPSFPGHGKRSFSRDLFVLLSTRALILPASYTPYFLVDVEIQQMRWMKSKINHWQTVLRDAMFWFSYGKASHRANPTARSSWPNGHGKASTTITPPVGTRRFHHPRKLFLNINNKPISWKRENFLSWTDRAVQLLPVHSGDLPVFWALPNLLGADFIVARCTRSGHKQVRLSPPSKLYSCPPLLVEQFEGNTGGKCSNGVLFPLTVQHSKPNRKEGGNTNLKFHLDTPRLGQRGFLYVDTPKDQRLVDRKVPGVSYPFASRGRWVSMSPIYKCWTTVYILAQKRRTAEDRGLSLVVFSVFDHQWWEWVPHQHNRWFQVVISSGKTGTLLAEAKQKGI